MIAIERRDAADETKMEDATRGTNSKTSASCTCTCTCSERIKQTQTRCYSIFGSVSSASSYLDFFLLHVLLSSYSYST
jgi:hypothetical protein